MIHGYIQYMTHYDVSITSGLAKNI